MCRLTILLLVISPFLSAQDWKFSLGLRYWPSQFETVRNDGVESRTESDSGSLGGLSMALTRDKWTFALTAMDGMSDYTLFSEPDLQFDQVFSKADYDLTVNYSLTSLFGVNFGYKRVETDSTSIIAGEDIANSSLSMNGLIGGIFLKHAFEFPLVVSAGVGYGFLQTSDIAVRASGVELDLETNDAAGLMWEAGANLVLGRFVFSLTYKFQDFRYDVLRSELPGDRYETKDLMKGPQLGVRYHF